MKKRNLVKIFTLTVCLSVILSTVVMAKEPIIKEYKSTKASMCAVDPHPTGDSFPD